MLVAAVVSLATFAAGTLVEIPVAAAAPGAPADAGLDSKAPVETPAKSQRNDFANLPAAPGQPVTRKPAKVPTGAPVEADTTSQRRHWMNADGSGTVEFDTGIARVKRGNAWQEVDLTLTEADDGTLRPKVTPTELALAATTGNSLATLTTPAGPVGLGVESLTPGRTAKISAKNDQGKAVYEDALGAIDVEVQPVTTGLKTAYTLASAGDATTPIVETLSPPAGWSARQAGASIEVVDGAGSVQLRWGDGTAFDSATVPAEAPVSMHLEPAAPGTARATVSVDPSWLAAPERVYPVTIDPLTTATFSTQATGAGDSWIRNDAATNGWADTELRVGNNTGTTVYRSLLTFQPTGIPTNAAVASATLTLNETAVGSCQEPQSVLVGRNTVTGFAGGTPAQSGTVWSTQPAFDVTVAPDITDQGDDLACPRGAVTTDVTDYVQNWVRNWDNRGGYANYGFTLRAELENDTAGWRKYSSAETAAATQPKLVINYEAVDRAVPAAPGDGAILASTTPTLSVNPISQSGALYAFRVTTGPDAESGTVYNSGWQSATSWTIPEGWLQDGVTYYWHTYTSLTGQQAIQDPSAVRKFKTDLRLGAGGPSPTDQVGPVSVNLATGNVSTSASGPSFDTVGGAQSVGFTYNSQAPKATGLTASYYTDDGSHTITNGDMVFQRLEPTPDFNRADGVSPLPAALSPNGYLVRWSGYLTMPTNDVNVWFGAKHDDGVRVYVGDPTSTPKLNAWTPGTSGETVTWGGDITAAFSAGVPVPITIEYFQATGPARLEMWIKGINTTPRVIPASWYTPEAAVLPAGWTTSVDLDGAGGYVAARRGTNSVTIVADDGSTTEFTAAPGGLGWLAPADSPGMVLADAGDGGLVLHDDDGQTYAFNSNGGLTSVTSALDDRKPAAAKLDWDSLGGTGPLRLTTITDPASDIRTSQATPRKITLAYQTEVEGACPTDAPDNLAVAPQAMLCKISYWDGSKTTLWYNANGQLARIENPGDAAGAAGSGLLRADFAYDTAGRLSQVRDPLAYDASHTTLASNRALTDNLNTVISYDTAGRASKVTLPGPVANMAAASLPAHSYRYVTAGQGVTGETQLDVAGLPGSPAFARKVTFDAGARTLSDVTPTGQTATTEWDPAADRTLSATDAAGRKSTTIYDTSGRATDSYGPAAASCFGTDRRPNGSCGASGVAHTSTAYDEGI